MFFLMIGFIKWNVRGLETQCHSECGHAWGDKHGPNAHDGGAWGARQAKGLKVPAAQRPKTAECLCRPLGACLRGSIDDDSLRLCGLGRSRGGNGAFGVIGIDRSPREAVQGSAEHFICHISALCARDGFQLRGDGGVIVPEVFRRFGGDGFGIRYRFIGLIRQNGAAASKATSKAKSTGTA